MVPSWFGRAGSKAGEYPGRSAMWLTTPRFFTAVAPKLLWEILVAAKSGTTRMRSEAIPPLKKWLEWSWSSQQWSPSCALGKVSNKAAERRTRTPPEIAT